MERKQPDRNWDRFQNEKKRDIYVGKGTNIILKRILFFCFFQFYIVIYSK